MNKLILCGLLLCLKSVAKVRAIANRTAAGWLITVLMLLASMLVVEAVDPVVSNVKVSHRPGTHKVDIRYDVADADGDALWITVKVSDNGGASYVVPAAGFSGDFHLVIQPGSGKHIVWDAGVDWGGKYSANMRFRVTASDTHETMVWIAPGTFTMGSPSKEKDRSGERPQTKVTISRGFLMSKYEVTQAQYKAVVGTNPSFFKGDNNPVEWVSWHKAVAYCAKLTESEKATGRLPVQGMSIGCRRRRSGSMRVERGRLHGLVTGMTRITVNWVSMLGISITVLITTHPVGEKKPNGWGLYDMHGNVFEWCQDWFGNYPGGSVTDPQGAATGSDRVLRGGYWHSDAGICRSAYRDADYPGTLNDSHYLGFRPVLAPSLN